jgi:hypothetical protein
LTWCFKNKEEGWKFKENLENPKLFVLGQTKCNTADTKIELYAFLTLY